MHDCIICLYLIAKNGDACTSFFDTLVGSVQTIMLAIAFGPFVRFISGEITQATSSLVSRLETRFSILEILETRLETRFSKFSRIENRVSRREDRDARDCQLTFDGPVS